MTRWKKPGVPTEADITREVRDYLRVFGVKHFKHWGGPLSERGVPDLLGVKTVRVAELAEAGVEEVGVFLAIELKGPRGRVSPEQEAWLREVQDAGGIAVTADSLDALLAALEELGPWATFHRGAEQIRRRARHG